MRQLTCTTGGSNKFWAGAVLGPSLTVRFGKIGTSGQVKTKTLASAAAAQAELANLIEEKLAKGYTDAAAAPAKSATPPKPPSGAAKPRSAAAKAPSGASKPPPSGPKSSPGDRDDDGVFPYLFYGANPGDWYEGANDGHRYEVRFREPPDAASRAQLARIYESELRQGPASAATEPWLWSGPWALFAIGERWTSAGRSAFAQVERMLDRVHAIVPVRQVVFWGARARGNNDYRTDQSVAARPHPIAGPNYPGASSPDLFEQPRDPSIPTPAVDDGFERARREVRDAAQKQRLDASSRAALAKGQIALRALAEPAPDEDMVPAGLAKRCPDGVELAAGCACGVDKKTDALIFVDAKGKAKTLAREPSLRSFSLREDASACLFITGDGIFEASLPGGTVRKLDALPDPKALTIAHVGSDRILVGTDDEILLLARCPDGLDRIATLKGASPYFTSYRDGAICFVSTYTDGSRLIVLGLAGREMKALARFPTMVLPSIRGGRPVAEVVGSDDGYEFFNLDQVYETFASAAVGRAALADKKAVTAVDKGGIRCCEIPAAEVVPYPSPTKAQQKLFENAGVFDVSASGRVVALTGDGRDYQGRPLWDAFAYLDDRGKMRVPEVGSYKTNLAVRADGAFALIADQAELWEIDLGSGKFVHLWEKEEIGWECFRAVAYAPGGLFTLLTDKHLRLLERGPKNAKVLATVKCPKAATMVDHRGGQVVLVMGTGVDKVTVVGVAGKTLKPLAKLRDDVEWCHVAAERVFAGFKQRCYEIQGIDGVAEAKLGAKG